jgi:hypothetical protein
MLQTAESTQSRAISENFTAEMTRLGAELKAARNEHRNRGRAARTAEAKLAALQDELKTLLEVRNCIILET